MHSDTSIFNKWIHKKIILPLLIFALFPHLMLLSMFSMNSAFTASFLDIEPDDLQFMFSMAYATIVGGLFVYVRLWGAFNVRNYLLIATILNILVLIGISITSNKQLILVLRFIQGPLALFEGVILLPIIMSIIRSVHAKFIAYSILYGLMMTSDKFSTSLVKFAIEGYNYKTMVFVIIGLHAIALLIYLIVFNSNRLFPKKPLYQLNLGAVVLLLLSLMSGAFFLIYGKRLNWFDSNLILLTFVSSLLFGFLFILHQRTSKRALYHFEIFKSERIVLGVILFFVFYIMRSAMGNVYQVMAIIWKWPWDYILRIQYINVSGTFAGVVAAYFLFINKVSFKRIFLIGFAFMAVSLYWFYHIFLPDTTVEIVGIPLFVEGLAQGIIFTPLVFYMIGAVHVDFTSSVAQTGTTIRFWTTTMGFALMQNLIWVLSAKYELLLTKNLEITQSVFQQNWNPLINTNENHLLINEANMLSVSKLKAQLNHQALLLANTEIFKGLFIFCIITILAIILYSIFKKTLSFFIA